MPRYTKRTFDILLNGRTIGLTLGIYKKGNFKFIFEDSTINVARHAVDRFIERKQIEGGRFAYKLLFQILADNLAQISRLAQRNVQSKDFKLEYDDFIYVFKNRSDNQSGDSSDPLLDFILITCYGKADKKVLVKPLIPMELEIYNEMKKRDKQIEKRVPKFKLYKRR